VGVTESIGDYRALSPGKNHLDINVQEVNVYNVMDVNSRNVLFSKGEIDRE